MDHEDPTLDVEAALRDEEALAALAELGAASTAPDEEPSATPPGDAAATPGEPGSDAEKAPSGPPQRGSTVRGGRGPASAPAGGVFWGSRRRGTRPLGDCSANNRPTIARNNRLQSLFKIGFGDRAIVRLSQLKNLFKALRFFTMNNRTIARRPKPILNMLWGRLLGAIVGRLLGQQSPALLTAFGDPILILFVELCASWVQKGVPKWLPK